MAARASIEQLRKSRTKEVSVQVDGSEVSFVISKIKVGQRKRLTEETVDEYGAIDMEHAARLAAEMCVVEPELTPELIDDIDLDVFLDLATHIAEHSGLGDLASVAHPDPEEGSAEAKSFPSAG